MEYYGTATDDKKGGVYLMVLTDAQVAYPMDVAGNLTASYKD